MMVLRLVTALILVAGAYPLGLAWWANRQTSLAQTLHWAVGAWLGWVGLLTAGILWPQADLSTGRYLALSLTGCAAVAVLGARRPIVVAWNFVVVGLLAVLLLPVAQGLGKPRLDGLQLVFLGGTVTLGVLNYLPTRFGPAALLLAAGCLGEIVNLDWHGQGVPNMQLSAAVGELLVAVVPWVGLAQIRQAKRPPVEFDRLWLGFRDRYGLVWGQRVREQFNRAAANTGWPVILRWTGLRLKPGTDLPGSALQDEIVSTLHALLKRFGPETPEETSPPSLAQ